MKMQNLESQLSIATTDKENLDKQLMSLINMPTKLEEISSQEAGSNLIMFAPHGLAGTSFLSCCRECDKLLVAHGMCSPFVIPAMSTRGALAALDSWA